MSRTDHPRRPGRRARPLPPFPMSVPRDRILHAVSQREPKLRECIVFAGVSWLSRKRIVRVVVEVDADLYADRFGAL